MVLDRRQVLFAGALPLLTLVSRRALPKLDDERADACLIVIELGGGNDGLNTLIPFDDDAYFRARPTLAIPKSRCLKIAEHDGLHPALAKLRARFDRGELAIVRGVGHPAPNLSHFKSQDIWATASTASVPPPLGWIGRMHDVALELGSWRASPLSLVAVGRDTPPAAFGAREFVAPAMETFAGFREDVDAPASRASVRKSARIDALERARDAARAASLELARAERTATIGAYPPTELGDHLRMAAQIRITGLGSRVIWITTPSFDTHTRQAREHENLLGRLDSGVDALLADLAAAKLFASTTVVTVSEFGRRVRESGVGVETGTDHGTSSVMLLAGGAVRGGLFGERERLEELDEDGNLHAKIDFRSVFASVIEDGFGLDSTRVLPEPARKLELLRRNA